MKTKNKNTETLERPQYLNRWTKQKNYIGHDWSNYYIAYSYTPNQSSLLQKSNWDAFLSKLDDYIKNEDCDVEVTKFNSWVSDFYQILIHEDENEALLVAEDLRDEMRFYPVLDEDYYCKLQHKQQLENIEWLAGCDEEKAVKIHEYLWANNPDAFDYSDGWVNEEDVKEAAKKV
jgi:hypothetical protein